MIGDKIGNCDTTHTYIDWDAFREDVLIGVRAGVEWDDKALTGSEEEKGGRSGGLLQAQTLTRRRWPSVAVGDLS